MKPDWPKVKRLLPEVFVKGCGVPIGRDNYHNCMNIVDRREVTRERWHAMYDDAAILAELSELLQPDMTFYVKFNEHDSQKLHIRAVVDHWHIAYYIWNERKMRRDYKIENRNWFEMLLKDGRISRPRKEKE